MKEISRQIRLSAVRSFGFGVLACGACATVAAGTDVRAMGDVVNSPGIETVAAVRYSEEGAIRGTIAAFNVGDVNKLSFLSCGILKSDLAKTSADEIRREAAQARAERGTGSVRGLVQVGRAGAAATYVVNVRYTHDKSDPYGIGHFAQFQVERHGAAGWKVCSLNELA